MPSDRTVANIFLVLFFLGLACRIGSGGPRYGPAKRPTWRVAGYLLMGFALLHYSLCSLIFVAISPRLETTGKIADLTISRGKSPAATFGILSDGYLSPMLLIEGQAVESIVEGEQARVRYVQYDRNVLDLTMLSGATAGSTFHDTDGPFLPILLMLLGTLSLYAARGTVRLSEVSHLTRPRD